jgi:hypothetical protein
MRFKTALVWTGNFVPHPEEGQTSLLRVSESKVSREIFGCKGEEETGGGGDDAIKRFTKVFFD